MSDLKDASFLNEDCFMKFMDECAENPNIFKRCVDLIFDEPGWSIEDKFESVTKLMVGVLARLGFAEGCYRIASEKEKHLEAH